MKSKWVKLLPLIIFVFLVSACSVAFPNAQSSTGNVYPGQFLTGDVYILKDGEKIGGNIAGFDTTLIIEEGATVAGDISLFGSQMEISGRVVGEVNVFGGSTQINESAFISGNLNQIATQLNIDPAANISGEINSFAFPEQEEANQIHIPENAKKIIRPGFWVIFQIIRSTILALINVLLIFLFTAPTLKVVAYIKEKVAVSWGIGLLIFFATPIVSLVFLITICLSPIGVILLLAFFAASIWGWTAISFIVGDTLTRWLKFEWSDVAETAFGSIIMGVIFSVLALIPFVGLMINFLLSAVGLGGIVLSKFGTIEKRK